MLSQPFLKTFQEGDYTTLPQLTPLLSNNKETVLRSTLKCKPNPSNAPATKESFWYYLELHFCLKPNFQTQARSDGTRNF